jgi:hypothetical protein
VRLAPQASADSDDAVDQQVVDASDSADEDESASGSGSDSGSETGVTDEDEAIRGANRDAHEKKSKSELLHLALALRPS